MKFALYRRNGGAFITLLAVAALALGACRDHRDPEGDRLGDRDMLAGRSAWPGITSGDLLLGYFEARSHYLRPFRDYLRDNFRMEMSVYGDLDTDRAPGNALIYDPTRASSSGRGTFGTVSGAAPITLSLVDLAEEYRQLCMIRHMGQLAPAQGSGEHRCKILNTSNVDDFVDDIMIEVQPAGIDVLWTAPDPSLGENGRNPVLEIVLPITVDVDPKPFIPDLFYTFNLAVRLQVASSTDRTAYVFKGYRHSTSALGDASFSPEGVFYKVHVEWRDLTGDMQDRIEPTLDTIARLGTALLDRLLNVRALNGAVAKDEAWKAACDDQFGVCPLSPALLSHIANHSRIDHAQTLIQLPSRADDPSPPARFLTELWGRWNNSLIHAIGEGANVVSATFNRAHFHNICDLNRPSLCGGSSPAPECAVCDFCDAPPAGMEDLCNFGLRYTLNMSDGRAIPSMSIPASPNLVKLVDVAPHLAVELHRLFTRPLDDYRSATGEPLRYEDVLWCSGSAAPSECPAGAVGAVFLLDYDYDDDGESFGDNCPYVSNPDQDDADDDGMGDACDGCPLVYSRSNADRDGDGKPDACDCDIDGDGCTNDGAGSDGAICESNGEDGTYDQRPRGANPLDDDDQPVDLDGDGFMDDCDPDDDDDGHDDDADNCPRAANPDQADENRDGIGDACDPLCRGPSDETCERLQRIKESAEPLELVGIQRGWDVLPECLVDGPDCMFWWFLDGLELVWRINIDRDVRRVHLDELELKSPIGVSALIPDLDGDAIEDLAIASPLATACNPKPCREATGEIVFVGSAKGEVLGRLSPLDEGAELGASMVRVGSELWVGAPGQYSASGSVTGAVVRVGFAGGKPEVVGSRFGRGAGERFGETMTLARDSKGQVLGVLAVAPLASGKSGKASGRIDLIRPDGTLVASVAGPGDGAGPGARAVWIGGEFSGFEGLLASWPAYEDGAGMVAAYDLEGGPKWKVVGEEGEALGTALLAPVDLDRDGVAHALIGAPGAAKGRGAVYTLGGEGKLGLAVIGGGKGFASVLSAPGDLDGDGFGELVVASPEEVLPGQKVAGVLSIFSGAGMEKK